MDLFGFGPKFGQYHYMQNYPVIRESSEADWLDALLARP